MFYITFQIQHHHASTSFAETDATGTQPDMPGSEAQHRRVVGSLRQGSGPASCSETLCGQNQGIC